MDVHPVFLCGHQLICILIHQQGTISGEERFVQFSQFKIRSRDFLIQLISFWSLLHKITQSMTGPKTTNNQVGQKKNINQNQKNRRVIRLMFITTLPVDLMSGKSFLAVILMSNVSGAKVIGGYFAYCGWWSGLDSTQSICCCQLIFCQTPGGFSVLQIKSLSCFSFGSLGFWDCCYLSRSSGGRQAVGMRLWREWTNCSKY